MNWQRPLLVLAIALATVALGFCARAHAADASTVLMPWDADKAVFGYSEPVECQADLRGTSPVYYVSEARLKAISALYVTKAAEAGVTIATFNPDFELYGYAVGSRAAMLLGGSVAKGAYVLKTLPLWKQEIVRWHEWYHIATGWVHEAQ